MVERGESGFVELSNVRKASLFTPASGAASGYYANWMEGEIKKNAREVVLLTWDVVSGNYLPFMVIKIIS